MSRNKYFFPDSDITYFIFIFDLRPIYRLFLSVRNVLSLELLTVLRPWYIAYVCT
jgi:hypothetical protein